VTLRPKRYYPGQTLVFDSRTEVEQLDGIPSAVIATWQVRRDDDAPVPVSTGPATITGPHTRRDGSVYYLVTSRAEWPVPNSNATAGPYVARVELTGDVIDSDDTPFIVRPSDVLAP
jgi:hypothetical protein